MKNMYLHVELLLTHFEVFCGMVSMCARKKSCRTQEAPGRCGRKAKNVSGEAMKIFKTLKKMLRYPKALLSSAGKIEQSVVDLTGEVM